MTKAHVLKYLRTIHGWLGVIIVPWIIIIGATGFYLNHSRMVLGWFQGPDYSEEQLLTWEGAHQVDSVAAAAIAAQYWPDEPLPAPEAVTYHDFVAYQFDRPSGLVIVARESGHYYVKTDYSRRTYAPDGTLVDKERYWSRIFKELHTRGWLGGTLGRWLADITALSMVLFGMTGIVLWWLPRARKFRRALGLGN